MTSRSIMVMPLRLEQLSCAVDLHLGSSFRNPERPPDLVVGKFVEGAQQQCGAVDLLEPPQAEQGPVELVARLQREVRRDGAVGYLLGRLGPDREPVAAAATLPVEVAGDGEQIGAQRPRPQR